MRWERCIQLLNQKHHPFVPFRNKIIGDGGQVDTMILIIIIDARWAADLNIGDY